MENVPAVILAGGKGTRLAPYTTTFPKPLMPIDDMPILEIVLSQLASCGLRNVKISVGHLAELIVTFCGSGKKWGLNIEYLREDSPQGTIGPLRGLEGLDVPFIVMNGDVLTDLDYKELYEHHLASGCVATIAAYEREVDISFGVLTCDERGRIRGFAEKPKPRYCVSMGVYVFEPRIVEHVPKAGAYGFDDLMRDLLRRSERMAAYRFEGLWLDIGRPEDYAAAVEVFK